MMKVFLIIIFWLTNNKTMTLSISSGRLQARFPAYH